MEKLSCAIIGQRAQRFMFKHNEKAPLCEKIKLALTEQIKELYDKGANMFYVGGAVGVDTWTSEIILDLKHQKEYAEIELSVVIPFPEQAENFSSNQENRYDRILSLCDYKKVINNHYSVVAYKRDNYYMVDHSQYLIAVYDQNRRVRSNTGHAVNYATKKGLLKTFIHPDTAKVARG